MLNNVNAIEKEITRLKEELNTVQGVETEVYSRIVGYYRSVRNWNLGKQGEYKDRVTFSKLTGRKINDQKEQSYRDPQNPDQDSFWSYSFFYRNTCPNCPPMKEALKNLELKARSFNVDTEEGMEEASQLNIFFRTYSGFF